MKTFLLVLSLAFALQTAQAQSPAPTPTVAQLLGTWQLVSVEGIITGQAQPELPYGPHPAGFIMYQPDGHMCAELTNGDTQSKNLTHATDAEKVAHYQSFIAYCGTYKLDAAASTLYHYPTVAWSPSYVGSTQPRPFRLEGDKLIITATHGLPNPKLQKMVLVWQRVHPSPTH